MKLILARQEGAVEDLTGFADLLRVPANATVVVPGPMSHNAPFVALSCAPMGPFTTRG